MKSTQTKKEQHRATLIIYLENPQNKWLTRQDLSTKVLKFKQPNQIHKTFTPEEIRDIELAAIDARRKNYTRLLSKIDGALLKAAMAGDVRAARLCYQRFENWSEKQKHEIAGKDGASIEYSDTERLVRIMSLLAIASKRAAEKANDNPR